MFFMLCAKVITIYEKRQIKMLRFCQDGQRLFFGRKRESVNPGISSKFLFRSGKSGTNQDFRPKNAKKFRTVNARNCYLSLDVGSDSLCFASHLEGVVPVISRNCLWK